MTGTELPALVTEVPGPESRAAVDVLARHECPAITARRARRAALLGVADDDPIVWAEAIGANVRDVDGNLFVDLTSGFGVALVGHRHPAVVASAAAQAQRLVHAMGDAWPDASRVALLRRLAAFAPPGLVVAILGLSGSDAIDAAVKTAVLATGRAGVLAFSGAYHGLALGVLGLQGYREAFTAPFRAVTHPSVTRLPYGCPAADLEQALGRGDIGLVVVEPILGRGGVRVPPAGWLAELASIARRHGALVCHDEVQTGLGRTGERFAGGEVVPDLLCVGKALGGGYPLSACLGTVAAMSAWGASTGEALHTQTFLGHPIGCAAATAVLELLEGGLVEVVRRRGQVLAAAVGDAGFAVRGRGLLLALEVGTDALATSRALLRRGFLVLPADATSLQLVPPVTLADAQVEAFVQALVELR
jgi:4-aminobutyrate aminotransferase-like enzyme